MSTDDHAQSTMKPHRSRARVAGASGRSTLFRTTAVALFDALAIYVIIGLISNRSWAIVGLFTIVLIMVNWAYLSPRTQASRWLTPGLALMLIFVVYPVLYTGYISLTNFQTGNLLSKEQAIERLEEVEIRTDAVTEVLDMAVYRNPSDELALLVGGGDREPFFGAVRGGGLADRPDELVPAADISSLGAIDVLTPPPTIESYELLSGLAITGEAGRLEGAIVDLPGGSTAQVATLSSVRVLQGGRRFAYDPATDTLEDALAGRTCVSGEGTFYCNDVPEAEVQAVARQARNTTITCSAGTCDEVPLFALDQTLAGWREVIGADNYVEVFRNDRIRAPFLRVLIWNVLFAFGSVLLNFALGLGLALALKNENMRGRSIYRAIYIIPYAIPGFLSILVWKGLLNSQFGQVNDLLSTFGIPEVDWLGTTSGAMSAVFLVNLWLGFPYMFLITSGALTSIPEDLLEAARVDGAGPWRSFWSVTLPLLLISTAPLLIGAFAFNFNNFVLIELLTSGGPPLSGYDVPVGATDLLISFTFNLAAGAGRGSQFALASAIIVLIFLVLATTSAMSFRLTKKLESIYDN